MPCGMRNESYFRVALLRTRFHSEDGLEPTRTAVSMSLKLSTSHVAVCLSPDSNRFSGIDPSKDAKAIDLPLRPTEHCQHLALDISI